MYLTTFWDHQRFAPRGGILAVSDALLVAFSGAVVLANLEQRVHKLESFPTYANQVVDLLREAKLAGVLPSQGMAEKYLTRVSVLLSERAALSYNSFQQGSAETPLERKILESFSPTNSVNAPDNTRLLQAARIIIREKVLPALRMYRDVFANEYLPACPASFSLKLCPNRFPFLLFESGRSTCGLQKHSFTGATPSRKGS